MFKLLDITESGVAFNNEILEDDTHNILNFVNLYTGSGVGVGDFNKDGLQDLFFGGNMVNSKLYLNKGGLKFEDISESAKIETDRWIMGVTVVDINQDGWDDIYLSVSGNVDLGKLNNYLYVNQHDNTFKEEAARYGIDNNAQCTHANFIDYDKDGDLDLFLIVNPTNYNLYEVNHIKKKKINGEAISTDLLYKNNGDGTFTDVSRAAGILIEGYSLGLNISDLNHDGWSDIYITNDFLTNDIVYINNQDGTFTDRAETMFKHTSFASMGIDVADINNDALPDIYTLDMFPEDNYRQKMIMSGGNYDRFEYTLEAGYHPQYSRNNLQLNNGNNTFSEIGQMAGVHKTDWSWAPLIADYDNDGLKDLFVTNGFRRDLGNLDYINYQNTNPFGDAASRKAHHLKKIKEQPGAKLPNYIYKNLDGLSFEDKSSAWGIDAPSYAHGAAFADLDNDGDLDIITNNVSMPSSIYENQQEQFSSSHFLTLDLHSSKSHTPLIGTKVYVHQNMDTLQYAEYNPYRGYLSSVDPRMHFGFKNNVEKVNVEIQWNNGKKSLMKNVPLNQELSIDFDERKFQFIDTLISEDTQFFQEDTISGLQFTHQEDHQVDFKAQTLLPSQHSRSGPCICYADINGDQITDFYIGGATGMAGTLYTSNGASFGNTTISKNLKTEETACSFLDFNQDGQMDLYVAGGGVNASNHVLAYTDMLYQNTNGIFTPTKDIAPLLTQSASCVLPNDFDQDGDIDIFIGSRVNPGQYPTPPQSYLLLNEGSTFKLMPTDFLNDLGMITDGIWADYDKDGDDDLIVVGEFMPITLLENNKGQLKPPTELVPNSNGLWHSISAADMDKDGDLDFLVGNIGLNTDYKASISQPLCIYANDFDKNGSIDPILCQYIDGVEYPKASRDRINEQIPALKVRFNSYDAYAKATIGDLFKRTEKKGMIKLFANNLESIYLRNEENGKFMMQSLPKSMQIAPINDFLIQDINQDGNLDALLVGNAYEANVSIGRHDAFTGGLLLGKVSGGFTAYRGSDIGFHVDKEAKEIAPIFMSSKLTHIIIGNNDDDIQLFKLDIHKSTTIAKQ